MEGKVVSYIFYGRNRGISDNYFLNNRIDSEPSSLYALNDMESATVKWKNYSFVFDRRKRRIYAPFEKGSTVSSRP